MWFTHNYFGTEESDYTTTTIDKDDEIACEHDLLYERAISFWDIHKADLIAIGQFTSDFLHTGNWHSEVGPVGLDIKAITERVLGTNRHSFDLQGRLGKVDARSMKVTFQFRK